jgi:hypothetical protein
MMTDATLEAVKAAVRPSIINATGGGAMGLANYEIEEIVNDAAQAAIGAMPKQEWQPIERSDVAQTGLRLSVRLDVGDERGMLSLTHDGQGFRLDLSPEQLRDIYNAVGEALPEPQEEA